jgi:hypothetical protein
MDTKDSAAAGQDNNLNSPADVSSRRGFLGNFSVMGLMALSGMMPAPQAQASSHQNSTATPKLSGISEVNVIRNDKFEVPGGTEHIVQYVISDDKGANVRYSFNISKVGQPGSYTMSANFRFEHFAPGQPLTEKPAGTKTFQMSAYGVEGEISGNRRNDTITTTIVAEDGTMNRQTQVVPVRLDLSELEGLDATALFTKIGNIHSGKETLK